MVKALSFTKTRRMLVTLLIGGGRHHEERLLLLETIHSFIHSFIHSLTALQPLLGPGFSFSLVIHLTQAVGLLGAAISPSQDQYLHTRQHQHNKRIHTPNIHDLCGIRIQDPSGRASEDSSCLRPRGHCDRHYYYIINRDPCTAYVYSECIST
jgi:hypothetical protein